MFQNCIFRIFKPFDVKVTPISHRRIEKWTGRKHQSGQFELRLHRLTNAEINEWTKPLELSDFLKIIEESIKFAVEIGEEEYSESDLFTFKVSEDIYLPGEFQNGT